MTSFTAFDMTTSKPDLRGLAGLVAVDRRSAHPLRRQIYDSFRHRIIRQELRAGELVPSSRLLARELRVSRLPVLNAYAQLLAEGYFESRVGSGTSVASSLPSSLRAAPKASRNQTFVQGKRPVSERAQSLPPYERGDWAENLGPFQVGQPDLHSFPMDLWSKLIARYSRQMRVKGLQYGDPMGLPELREAIAGYLRTARGVRAEAGQIMIVSGSQQALDLTSRVLLDRGSPVWMEEPGYWLVRQALQAIGARIVPVPVDAEGLNVGSGQKLSRKARAVFVAPSHQYPLGVTMSATRRLQLLEWAQRVGAWIVEDDYDSEYRYESKPVASLQGMDRYDRVIYIGTFSKVMFPSLRLGYLVLPPDLVERFAAVRRAMDLCPSHIPQAVMFEFMREGHFARHLRRMRPIYAERRRTLVTALEREFGQKAEIMGDAAGMHLALLLKTPGNDQAIAARAAMQALWLSPLSASYANPGRRCGFVLGFGNSRANQIGAALRQLKSLCFKQ
ncbi:MAG: PLP-dependent aminotransferase family protein [Chthoniobacterales bacterium]|nr:PLP-dependent aminotransferase family protein [Chthoniobacterales bacterium]